MSGAGSRRAWSLCWVYLQLSSSSSLSLLLCWCPTFRHNPAWMAAHISRLFKTLQSQRTRGRPRPQSSSASMPLNDGYLLSLTSLQSPKQVRPSGWLAQPVCVCMCVCVYILKRHFSCPEASHTLFFCRNMCVFFRSESEHVHKKVTVELSQWGASSFLKRHELSKP